MRSLHLFLLMLAAGMVLILVSQVTGSDQKQPFGDNVILRGNLDCSRLRFSNEKKGTVAFLGGSITEMNGYRPMVEGLLRKRFSGTDFNFINAGISSTCSTTGAFRLDADVLSHGPVDLLFVEFAVNDDQDAHHNREQCIRGLEGIIRHARTAYPKIDIVVTFFVNEGMLQTLQTGKTPLTVSAHQAVAEHYEVPTINLAKEVAQEIDAGGLTWKGYGGVHPAPLGNAICASMIESLFDRAWNTPLASAATAAPHSMPEKPLDPLNYEHGRFIEPKEATITNGWSMGVPDWGSLPGGKRDRFTHIPMLCATNPGAEASLKFQGTAVGAYIVAGPDAGVVLASIDGGAFQPFNLLAAYSKDLHYPWTVMLGTELKPGTHTLTLRMSDQTEGTGHVMRIMQFVAN